MAYFVSDEKQADLGPFAYRTRTLPPETAHSSRPAMAYQWQVGGGSRCSWTHATAPARATNARKALAGHTTNLMVMHTTNLMVICDVLES